MSTTAEWATAIATGVGSVGVIISLGVASCQIQLARQTLQASTIYNIEKDFSDIFAKRLDAKFVECYRPLSDQNKSGSGLNLPSICADPTARETFFDVLNLYRMLLDMAKLRAVPDEYVNVRIQAFCSYLMSPSGRATIEEFKRKGLVREDLSAKITSQCGGEK
jgi:hypothetical protein